MSNIQSILALGGILLLASISLRFNTTLMETSSVEVENKVFLTAFSLADDMIEEIKQKSFDQATIQFPITNASGLTPPDKLGPDVGEVYPNFNDIDDYNGYSKTISAPHAEDYHIKCMVVYVQESNPNMVSSTQTFYKRLTVKVTSPFLRDKVEVSFIFTLK